MTNVNTPGEMVTGSPEPPAPEERRRLRHVLRRWWWLVAIATVMSLIATVFVVSLLVHVPYVIEAPGSAEPVEPLITVPTDRSYPTPDDISLVTVTVDTQVTLFDKFRAQHSSDQTLVPAK